MVQQEVLEPELGQEQRPRVKLEPIPEAVPSPPREGGVDSGATGSRLSLVKWGQGRGRPQWWAQAGALRPVLLNLLPPLLQPPELVPREP